MQLLVYNKEIIKDEFLIRLHNDIISSFLGSISN